MKMSELERRDFLCNEGIFPTLEIQKQLKCRYVNRGIPFLKIAPFKEEEVYLEPRILIFHDVIYDEEIDVIKCLAKPKVCILFYTLFQIYCSACCLSDGFYSEVQ